MSRTFDLRIDFTGTGTFVDVTAYLMSYSLQLGLNDERDLIATTGQCTIELKNTDKRFSPDYASGAYYGNLVAGKAVRLQMKDGATTITIFRGYTAGWSPSAGARGDRRCTLVCVDLLDRLNRIMVSLPLCENVTGDTLIRHLANLSSNNSADGLAYMASGAVTFAGQAANGNTFTCDGVVYTFRTTLSTGPAIPNEVLIGATIEATVDNACAAVNGAAGEGTTYSTGTTRIPGVTATPKANYYRQVMHDNPVRYYRLGEPSGTTAADSGSNGAAGNGTIAGSPTMGVAGALANDPDKCITFDGTNDNVSIPILALDNRSFSIEMWIKPQTHPVNDWGDIFTGDTGIYSGNQSLAIRLFNTGTLDFIFTPDELYSTSPINFGVWSHICCVCDYARDTSTIYLNGAAAGSSNAGPFAGVDPPLYIGAPYWFNKGDMDEFAIYLGALTADQVAAHYAARAVAVGFDLFATIPGVVGNAHTLSVSGANLTASGTSFAGGTDGMSIIAPSLQTGIQTFTLAGDTWKKDQTTALQAMQDVTRSEYGFLWISRAGSITWKNGQYILTKAAETPALTLSGEMFIEGAERADDIANHITVNVTPRTVSAQGVVARMDSTKRLAGRSGAERWNPQTMYGSNDSQLHRGSVAALLPPPGSTTFSLNFTDPVSGKRCGAQDLVLPLAPTTDYIAMENADGTGYNYTNYGCLFFSVAYTGSDAQVSIVNTALGPIYLTMLQIRGKLITSFDQISLNADDATSQSAYGIRDMSITLPLPVSQIFAQQLANWLLSRYKDNRYKVTRLNTNKESLNSVNLWSIEIGDTIQLTESQTSITNEKFIVLGVQYSWNNSDGVTAINFNVSRLDDVTYWVLADATYGALGTTSRLGI